MSRDVLPRHLCSKTILSKRCVHMWEEPEIDQVWTENQANQNDWPKKTRKKCPVKVIQVRQGPDSVPFSLSPPTCLPTRTGLFFVEINTLLASLLSVFVGVLFCKAEGPGPGH